MSVNTVKTVLRRVRQQHPALWAELAAVRAEQRAARPVDALERAGRHSTRWHRRRFYREWGYWPRE